MKLAYLAGFLLLLFSPVIALGDIVILNNGNRIEGIIEDDGGNTIYVQTAGGRVSLPRSSISRIEEHSLADNLYLQGRNRQALEEWPEAIDDYSDALRQADASTNRQRIETALEESVEGFISAMESRNALEHGLQDLQTLESIKRKLSSPDLLARLQKARRDRDTEVASAYYQEAQRLERLGEYRNAIERYEVLTTTFPEFPLSANLDTTIIDLMVRDGIEIYNATFRPSSTARTAFRAVLEKDPDNNTANYYMGLMAFQDDDYARARQYLEPVDPNQLDPQQATRHGTLMTRINIRENSGPVSPRTSVRAPLPQPPGMVTGEPEPVVEEAWYTRWWNGAIDWANGLSESFGGSSDVWLPRVLELALIGGAIVAGVYVLWLWPVRWVYRDIPGRRVMYANWRTIVNYTGIVGALLYLIDKWRHERPDKRCPGCNRSLDNPNIFENYNFSQCPYCEIEIKPPYTMPDLIDFRSESISVSKGDPGAVVDETQRDEMILLVEDVMAYARQLRASDVHIEPEDMRLLLRFRVDGLMAETIELQPNLNALMVSCIKIMSSLNIAEKRLPQDGHFRTHVMGSDLNIRVSTIPTRRGEKAVLRLLDPKIAMVTLETLGMRKDVLERYRRAIASSHGIILATGPTGSGKTTLHYASLQTLNDGSKNIVTVEDPIEYDLDGVNQVQHNADTGMTFATALRSILRQDPDVIMVGEIRDSETASIAVNAALTGHTVFSTLHTIDTSTAIARLVDLEVDIKQLSSALRCVVAQRLVRKLCPHCKTRSVATAEELRAFGEDRVHLEGQVTYTSTGCKECSGSGYQERTGLYEVLFPTDDVRERVEQGASARAIRQASRDAGMKTLREEGIEKILAGETSISEVIRVTADDSVNEQ